jgi:hypothetical protein
MCCVFMGFLHISSKAEDLVMRGVKFLGKKGGHSSTIEEEKWVIGILGNKTIGFICC